MEYSLLLPENDRCPKCGESMIAPEVASSGHLLCVRCVSHFDAEPFGYCFCSTSPGSLPFFSAVEGPPFPAEEIPVPCKRKNEEEKKGRKKKTKRSVLCKRRKKKRSADPPPYVECFDCRATVLARNFNRHARDWCPKRLLPCKMDGCEAWIAAEFFTEDPSKLWFLHRCSGVIVCRLCIVPLHFQAGSWEMKAHFSLVHSLVCSGRLLSDTLPDGEEPVACI